MAANNDSPRSPPLNEQVPNNQRLGTEIPLGLPEHMPQQEMTPAPVAPDEDNDNFLGLYYRVVVEALDEWASVTSFMRGSIGYVDQEPEITDDFKKFVIRMFGSNWEKRVLSYQTMIVQQLYALVTGFSKLTSRMKRAWLAQFDSWSSSQLRTQIKELAESGGFLEIDYTFGYHGRWRGINLRHIYILLLFQCFVIVR